MAAILIVEDDMTAAQHLEQCLASEGHSCIRESHGRRALEIAKERPIDLVILDVMLPDISGFEVCRSIRRDSSLYTIPILMVSAMRHEEEILHGLEQGADDYVAKPFDDRDFVARVSGLLRASATENEVDEVTSLPGNAATKREVQRRISCGETFSLIYIELLNVREFAYAAGPDARLKAIRHAARALRRTAETHRCENFYSGHLGGGHFVCLVQFEEAEPYCERLMETWTQHMKSFYTNIGQEKIYESVMGGDKKAKGKFLDLLCCVTTEAGNQGSTVKMLFDVLSHIRKKSIEGHAGGIIIDRRAPSSTLSPLQDSL